MGRGQAVCWRWLGAAVSAADTAGAEQWGRAVVQMAGDPPPRGTAFLAGRASVPACPQPPNLPELACFLPACSYPEGQLESVYRPKTGLREIKPREGKTKVRGCREPVTGRDALG